MNQDTIRAAARELAPTLQPIDIEQLVFDHTAASNAANAAGKRPETSLADFIEHQDALNAELLDRLDVDNVRPTAVHEKPAADRELLGYARLLELCDEFGITETDDLKHRLEEWDRWNEAEGRKALDGVRRAQEAGR